MHYRGIYVAGKRKGESFKLPWNIKKVLNDPDLGGDLDSFEVGSYAVLALVIPRRPRRGKKEG